MKNTNRNQYLNTMSQNPDYYKLGIIYFNSKDPRIFVPKRYKYMGMSLNFANIYTYLLLIACIGIIVLMEIYWK
jgi:uncharacterized membrane protein